MPRRPPNCPERGDRCIERGKPERVGEVVKMSTTENNWCTVKWDGVEKTMLCHVYGLEKINEGVQ